MKNKNYIWILIFLLVIRISTLFAQEPPNLSILKAQAITYYQSGEYFDAIQNTLSAVRIFLQKKINENSHLAKPKHLAVVFDIDETTLSNYPHLLAMDFGFVPKQVNEVLNLGDAQPLAAARALFYYAQNNHLAVFFITGRDESLKAATIKNLQKAGYRQWTGLYLKPNNYTFKSNAPYKTETRKRIQNQGYEIIANIGDQTSDLVGGYSERTFKLPNPFYVIP